MKLRCYMNMFTTLLSIRHLLLRHSIFSFNGSGGGETFIGAAGAAADYHSGPLHFTRIIEGEEGEKEVSDFNEVGSSSGHCHITFDTDDHCLLTQGHSRLIGSFTSVYPIIESVDRLANWRLHYLRFPIPISKSGNSLSLRRYSGETRNWFRKYGPRGRGENGGDGDTAAISVPLLPN